MASPVADDLDARIAATLAQQAERRRAEAAERGLWLSHHPPEDHERCTTIAGRSVCRRCLALYPLALVVALAGLAGFAPWPERLDLWFIWLLCVPGTIEYVAEQVGLLTYSARRQTIATLLIAPALGRGMAYELDDRWSWEFWGPVLVFCTLWFVAAIIRHVRQG